MADKGSGIVGGVPGFDGLLGVHFVAATGSRVVLELEVEPALHQPFGVLHGGAVCTLVETAASVGATEWLAGRGHAVGLQNCTKFHSSVSTGRVTAVAEPLRQGRSQQLWSVVVTADTGVVVAEGEVRLATRVGGAPAPVIG